MAGCWESSSDRKDSQRCTQCPLLAQLGKGSWINVHLIYYKHLGPLAWQHQSGRAWRISSHWTDGLTGLLVHSHRWGLVLTVWKWVSSAPVVDQGFGNDQVINVQRHAVKNFTCCFSHIKLLLNPQEQAMPVSNQLATLVSADLSFSSSWQLFHHLMNSIPLR